MIQKSKFLYSLRIKKAEGMRERCNIVNVGSEEALQEMKTNKAPGVDNVRNAKRSQGNRSP